MTQRGALPEQELEHAVSGLKPFQQRTVQTVVARMYDNASPQRRFLVADEVGLGKTKIARALVAETIRRHWDNPEVDRIDIIYICSNQQIARQNIEDLRVLGGAASTHHADRLTMLPAALDHLNKSRVNVIAFTPDTSLRFGHAGGRVAERAMLHHILTHPDVLGPQIMARQGARRLLVLNASGSFDSSLAWAQTIEIPRPVARSFKKALGRRGLIDGVVRMTDGRRTLDSSEQWRLVGDLRQALAEACVELLTPDLIILDEFQKFTDILEGKAEDGQLAQLLFNQESARVLLLSATPYKMLSSAEDDESHFEGFDRTVRFLLGAERTADHKTLRPALGELRRGVLGHRDPQRLAESRDRIESILRSVMVRTERLAATPERDGMLRETTNSMAPVTAEDVADYVGTDRIAQILENVPSMVEYWKSAPYLFNFMDEYKVKKEMDTRLQTDDGALRSALTGNHMLDWRKVESYGKLNPRNPRLRWLIDDLAAQHAFDLLWVPPSLPQTQLSGTYSKASGFTKRLLFSGWTVVPKAVAALTSYEQERRHHRPRQKYSARKFSGRVVLATDTERFANLALLLPTQRLADLGDPLALARELGAPLPLSLERMKGSVRARIQAELAPFLAQAVATGATSNRWYAAAQYLLDDGLKQLDADAWLGDDRDSSGLTQHLKWLKEIIPLPIAEWGRPPEDLEDVLTDLAVGSPAVCLLRALRRTAGRYRWPVSDFDLQTSAAQLAWAFRSIFNNPEADHLIASGAKKGEDFWRTLVRHCIDGGLGSVLDEWLHLLPEQLRLDGNSASPLDRVARAAGAVLRLADGQVGVDVYGPTTGQDAKHHMRTHFAMRFGQARGATAEGENPVDVRNAFNSPFRPFVLVTTSVGQEGLDFHHYSHAVVHWNLPGNPVDLEQREGRVHRYKGHAVRKNLARDFGTLPELVSEDDVWSKIFAMAQEADGGLRPWWVYPGEFAIERQVPVLPMSRETGRLRELVEATSLYRMTLGQPRQSELLAVLAGLDADQQEEIRRAVLIDLSPGPWVQPGR